MGRERKMKEEEIYHKWYRTWAGMYDATYKCHTCGKEFMETFDYTQIVQKPEKGCVELKKGVEE